MPAPTSATYSAQAKIDAHNALLLLLAAGAGTKRLEVLSAADTVLVTFELDDPVGTVNGTTGQLTLSFVATTVNGTTTGAAAWARLVNGSDVTHLSMPCAEGTVAVSGFAVLNQLSIVGGQPVTLLGATIG